MLAAALLAPMGAAQAQDWQPEYEGGELQPLPDGFPERPIVLINTDDAGSPDGIYARTLQEILNDGISPQRVNVLDRPSTSFGTWEALQFAAERARRRCGPRGRRAHRARQRARPPDGRSRIRARA